ncbi:MAG TPA: hypothetical protein VNN79_16665 [Actinomycetota bacterium]|jgi:hypothetical protein|nr:hypothetical protein [Actinomycetota bacterium]
MAKKRSTAAPEDPLAAYRRVRKPMPPPTRTDEDRRRDSLDSLERREARRAADEAVAGRRAGSGDDDRTP